MALKSVTKGDCLLKPLPENKREHIPGLNADPNDKEQVTLLCMKSTLLRFCV